MSILWSNTIALTVGLATGMLLAWGWLRHRFARRHHLDEVRWRRRAADAEAERDEHRARLDKLQTHATARETTLEQALAESEETLALLSDEKLPAFERELSGRNQRIKELEHELAVHRARLADAKDEVATFERRHAQEAAEMSARARRIDELSTQVAGLEQQMSQLASRTRHELVASETSLRDQAQQLQLLESELANAELRHQQDAKTLAAKLDENARLKSARQALEQRARQRDERIQTLAAEAMQGEHRLKALRAALTDSESTIQAALHETADRDTRIRQLSEEEQRRATQLEQARAMQRKLEQELAQAHSELQSSQATIDELRQRVQDYEKRLPDYETELRKRDHRLADLDRDFKALRRKLPALNDAIRERETSIEDLVSELARQRERFASLKQQVQPSRDVNVAVERAHGKVIELKHFAGVPAPEPGRPARRKHHAVDLDGTPAWCLDAPRGDKDDLKRIRGIGPVIERTLNSIGIFHFEQLARLESDDVEWVAAHIETFPKRIERDRWIEQARKLTDEARGDQRSGA